jgi:hypothetical protein
VDSVVKNGVSAAVPIRYFSFVDMLLFVERGWKDGAACYDCFMVFLGMAVRVCKHVFISYLLTWIYFLINIHHLLVLYDLFVYFCVVIVIDLVTNTGWQWVET